MTHAAVTVAPSTAVSEIAEILVAHRINSAPFVDDDGRLVGFVTTGDLLHRAADERTVQRTSVRKESFWRHAADREHPELDRAEGRTAAEIMTRQDVLDQIAAHGGSINPLER